MPRYFGRLSSLNTLFLTAFGIALYYYARVVRTMFLDMPVGDEGVVTLDSHNALLLAFLAVPTLVLGVYWAPVFEIADRSVRFFLG